MSFRAPTPADEPEYGKAESPPCLIALSEVGDLIKFLESGTLARLEHRRTLGALDALGELELSWSYRADRATLRLEAAIERGTPALLALLRQAEADDDGVWALFQAHRAARTID